MYTLTIKDTSTATSVRPRQLSHNKLACIMGEIEIYQMSYMRNNNNMAWFEPCLVAGFTIMRIAHVVFVIECVPFEQDSAEDGIVTSWYEIGDSYNPNTDKSLPMKKMKTSKKLKTPTVEIRTKDENWVTLYNPDEVFSDAFMKFLGLVSVNEK